MPRTRAQAHALEVESPLVSLDNIPRTKRKATNATPSKSSSATRKATDTKTKRARKTGKKTVVKASDGNSQKQSEIETLENKPTSPQTQEPTWTQEQSHAGEATIFETPQRNQAAQPFEAAQDNGSTPPANYQPDSPDLSCLSSPSNPPASLNYSSAKKASIKAALATLRQYLKKPVETIGQRFSTLRRNRIGAQPDATQTSSSLETPTLQATMGSASSATAYSLAETEILDAAFDIVLHRMSTEFRQPQRPPPSTIRCPCCRGDMKLECPEGHDIQSLLPFEVNEEFNGVLMSIFSEVILETSEKKEAQLRSEREAEAQAQAEAAQQAQQEQNHNGTEEQHGSQQRSELSARQKDKKRARDANDTENSTDGAHRAQRCRLSTSAGQTTPAKRTTTLLSRGSPGRTPRVRSRRPRPSTQSLSYSELVQHRAMGLHRTPTQSMMNMEETMAHLREQELAAQQAQEVADEEARNAVTRAAMERHMILGPISEDSQDVFEVPVYSGPYSEDFDFGGRRTIPAPQTPTSNNWGIRSFLSSVSGSVRRRLGPMMGHTPDQAVPFTADGGFTTMDQHRNANGAHDTNSGEMAFSLYTRPPSISPPREPTSLAKEDSTLEQQEQDLTAHEESEQIIGTEQTNENDTTRESYIADADSEEEPGSASRKRKRAPSPDVIPNPPGCSYGMDLDYFTYSDDEIEEAEECCRREAEAKAAAESAAHETIETQTESDAATRPPEKRARLSSPEAESSDVRPATTSTPSHTQWLPPTPPGWARPTTTVYNGEMFRGMRYQQPSTYPYPITQDPQSIPRPLDLHSAQALPRTYPQSGTLHDLRKLAVERRLRSRMQVVNNHVNNETGTAANTIGQSSSLQQGSQPYIRAPAQHHTAQQSSTEQAFMRPPQQPLHGSFGQVQGQHHDMQSSSNQQTISKPAQSIFQHQRDIMHRGPESSQETSQQQHAPESLSNGVSSERTQGPSRATMTRSTVGEETVQLPPIKPMSAVTRGQPVTERCRPKTPSRLRNRMPLSSSPASQASPVQARPASGSATADQENLMQVFGDDEHGRRAYELYQSCPTGDLNTVQWPEFDNISAVNDEATSVPATQSEEQHPMEQSAYERSFEEFANELEQGLIVANELVAGLPL